MTIADKLSALRGINIEKSFDEILRDNEDEICDLNRDQMYEKGVMDVNNPGQKLEYAESTKKAKKKAPFNNTEFITLKWAGAFHKALKLIIFKDKFVIASDNKIWGNYLETQTRFQSALGMTKESKGEIREVVRDEMIKKIREDLSTAIRLRA